MRRIGTKAALSIDLACLLAENRNQKGYIRVRTLPARIENGDYSSSEH